MKQIKNDIEHSMKSLSDKIISFNQIIVKENEALEEYL